MAVIAIPKILREKLSDEGADALVLLFNEFEEKNKQFITEEKFERRLAEVKVEFIIWMFAFWVTQMFAILALFFKK